MRLASSSGLRWRAMLVAIITFWHGRLLAQTQTVVPAGTNLFGDDLVCKLSMAPNAVEDKHSPPLLEGYSQTLVFQDGSHLCGEIVSLGNEEVVWQRPDVKGLLHFPRAEVRRIFFGGERSSVAAKPSEAIHATVRFACGDWLYGDLRSSDGESFALSASSGVKFDFPRSRARSVRFDRRPTPVVGFFGNALDLDEWSGGNDSVPIVAEDGSLTVRGMRAISRALSPVNRFEASIEFPIGYEESTRLTFSAAEPKPRARSPSAVEMDIIGRRLIVTVAGGRLCKVAQLPQTPASAKAPTSYHLFFDGPAQTVRVSKNGEELLCWNFGVDPGNDVWRKDFGPSDRAPAANGDIKGWEQAKDYERTSETVRAVRLGRAWTDGSWGSSAGEFCLRSIAVEPWDGAVPENRTNLAKADQVSYGGETTRPGVLKSISDSELAYSGKAIALQAGMTIQFASPKGAPGKIDCRLYFGEEGRLGAREVRIGQNVVHCHSAFGTPLNLPLAALRRIDFPATKWPPSNADLLVFDNGDTLPGSLVRAASDALLRWRGADGRDVDVSVGKITGVRFKRGENHALSEPAPAALELRNGDRFSGKVVSFEKGSVKFKDQQAGTFSIATPGLWRFVPTAPKGWSDGALNPDKWLRLVEYGASDLSGSVRSFNSNSWLYIDGTYLLCGPTGNTFAALHAPVEGPSERFQISFNATNLDGGTPQFGLQIGERESIRVDYGRDIARLSRTSRFGSSTEELNMSDNRSERFSRMNVRAFVDPKGGTVDLCFDGFHVARVGSTPVWRIGDLGRNIYLYAENRPDELPMAFSEIQVRPWSGALPEPHEKTELFLTNGDIVDGAIRGVSDGKLAVEGEIGLIDFPLTQIQEVEFGGVARPRDAAARLRFTGGEIVHVQSYRFDGQTLSAHSDVLGDFQVPTEALSELIPNPSQLRFPHPLVEGSRAAATPEK